MARALRLPDDRLLEVEVTGPADGDVLVFHHGTPGSLVQEPRMAAFAHALGLRLVTLNRAGYGASTRQPGRCVADAAADVRALLDDLGADTCLGMGWSGGGPHALACAALLPDRVRATTVIAGSGPSDADDLDFTAGMDADNVEEFAAAAGGEAVLRAALEPSRTNLAVITGDQVTAAFGTLLASADRAVLPTGTADYIAAQCRTGLATSVDGWLDDDLAFLRPWGFDVAAIGTPVTLIQGTEDRMVPAAHGRWLAAHVPGAELLLEDGEGHLSVAAGRMDRIVADLVARGR